MTTIYITADQDAALKRLSGRTKVPVAEYVRQGIDLILGKHGDAIPGQLSFDDALARARRAGAEEGPAEK